MAAMRTGQNLAVGARIVSLFIDVNKEQIGRTEAERSGGTALLSHRAPHVASLTRSEH